MKRYDKPEDQKKAGIEIALDIARYAAERMHGLYLMTPRTRHRLSSGHRIGLPRFPGAYF
jgi:hypothetical protein